MDEAAVVELLVAQLHTGLSPRLRSEDVEHARALAEVFDEVPPILVHAETSTVIDGAHRLLAARFLHRETIRAVLFAGSASEAAIEAIRQNVAHGKPLSLHEREAAASRIVREHPQWSDRRIAANCGLSPTTVGKLRVRAGGLSPVRVGADGRRRPLRGVAGQRVRAELQADPSLGGTELAKRAGVSRTTASRAIASMRDHRPVAPKPGGLSQAVHALISTAGGAASPEDIAAAVPLGYVYEAANESRRLAAVFMELSERLERRARGR